ncbi:hypothetical protein JXA88_16990 [Candidatus Fermentibacteria bacterium]|nr:hypothetical protein [Candidatus Fermentibacteria bacterium]
MSLPHMVSGSVLLAVTMTLHAAPHREVDTLAPDPVLASPQIRTLIVRSDENSTALDVEILGSPGRQWPAEIGIGLVAVAPRGRIMARLDAVDAHVLGQADDVARILPADFPEDLVLVGPPGIWRELRVVRVAIRPQWGEGESARVARRVRVTIINAGGQGVAELDHPARPVSLVWDRLFRAHVLNYEAFQPPRLTIGTGPRYIVISRSRFTEHTPAFVEWKTRQGYGVEVITLEDLGYTDPFDRNAINATKRCIMEAYTSWDPPLEFVLLTGDMYAGAPAGSIYSKQFTDILGYYPLERYYDQWYALVDGPDLLPDIMLGRFPDSNAQRMGYQLGKTVGYEMSPHIEGTWQRNSVMTAIHSNPTHPTILTKQAVSDSLVAWGMTVHEFYCGQAIPARIIPAINQGVAFYNYRGEWCGENDWGGTFYPNDAAYISNVNKLGVWTAISCSTADFVFNYPINAEILLRLGHDNPAAPRGAVAVVGSQGYTHANFNNPLDWAFYHAFTHQDATLLGEAFMASKIYVASVTAPSDSQTTTLCEYTILGDPSLQVWTDVPTPLSVAIDPPSVPEGMTTPVTLSVTTDAVSPVSGALACLRRGGDVYVYGYTDDSGAVTLPVMPTETGTSGVPVDVTITAVNRIPHYGTLPVLTSRPAPPGNVTVVIDRDARLKITWNPVLSDERGLPVVIDRYEVSLDDDAFVAADRPAASAGTTTAISFATTSPGTFVRVVAVSREGRRSHPSEPEGAVSLPLAMPVR